MSRSLHDRESSSSGMLFPTRPHNYFSLGGSGFSNFWIRVTSAEFPALQQPPPGRNSIHVSVCVCLSVHSRRCWAE